MMKKHSTLPSQLAEITISIPRELQQQIDRIATQEGETFSEMICLALTAYFATYSRQCQSENSRLSQEEARLLMRKLGHGLGKGDAPHNGAGQHDQYLYNRK